MTFVFKKAIRENINLIIGLAGGTGSGKTFSAMRLASGISGSRPFVVIDTEAGRALHYADQFNFDHGTLVAPFTPSRYLEAIKAADAAGYPVIIVDSASHEHAGEGGVLDMHETELDRMAGDDWKKRESCKMAAWIKPKMEHKSFVRSLLQVRAHLILCFRAEEKVEIGRDERGKTIITKKQGLCGKDGWFPITEKSLPFETTVYFLMLANNPGIPEPIKLQQQHMPIFTEGKLIDEGCGQRLAQWATSPGIAAPEPPRPEPAADGWHHVVIDGRSDKNDDPDAIAHRYQIENMGWVVCLDRDLWPMLEKAHTESSRLWIRTERKEKGGKPYIEITESSEIEP